MMMRSCIVTGASTFTTMKKRSRFFSLLFVLYGICFIIDNCYAYESWWSLGVQGGAVDMWTAAGGGQRGAYVVGAHHPSACTQVRGLSPGQTRFCQLRPDHMGPVSEGASLGIRECQWQFVWRRWNCSIVDNDTSVFGPTIETASRETAFIHSISTAGVLYAVSRACREGQLTNCGCSRRPRPKQLNRDWLWGGCGDNTEYGYQVAQAFVDAREREKNHPRHSMHLAKMLMNIHNNEAGRRAVSGYVKAACKCHGVSGSCSMKTCWNQLPSFREVGDRLMHKYDTATEVQFNKPGTILVSRGPSTRRTQGQQQKQQQATRPGKEDVVFIEQSPDYCTANPSTGWGGTHGRRCQRSALGMDGCDLMCCGRGYNSIRTKVSERCNCKFHWCCYVKCDTCEQTVDIYICK